MNVKGKQGDLNIKEREMFVYGPTEVLVKPLYFTPREFLSGFPFKACCSVTSCGV